MQLEQAAQFISGLLLTQLSDKLTYHDLDHTNGVLNAATELAAAENVSDEHDLTLLRTAALFHDCGYVNTYDQHEEESCQIARDHLPNFGYSEEDIEVICSLIMKTKMPQQPHTILEKILCDADLDYLGKDDFEETGNKLFKEWVAMGKIQNEDEWNRKQIKFLESHTYWTASALNSRNQKKAEHLQKLKDNI